MIRAVRVVLVLLAVGVAATAYAQWEWVKYVPASGFQPPAVVVLEGAQERNRLCAEYEHGLLACRSVSEFRQWARDRPQK